MEIQRLQGLLEQIQRTRTEADDPSAAGAFRDLLKQTSELQKDAAGDAERFLTTGEGELHEVQIGLAKADLAFRFLVEVRNKLSDAYQEIQRLPL